MIWSQSMLRDRRKTTTSDAGCHCVIEGHWNSRKHNLGLTKMSFNYPTTTWFEAGKNLPSYVLRKFTTNITLLPFL